jgi:hypothetical protein
MNDAGSFALERAMAGMFLGTPSLFHFRNG